MGLSLRDSETGQLFRKDRDYENAQRLYLKGWDKSQILEATELTEEEFEKEVVRKVKKNS